MNACPSISYVKPLSVRDLLAMAAFGQDLANNYLLFKENYVLAGEILLSIRWAAFISTSNCHLLGVRVGKRSRDCDCST